MANKQIAIAALTRMQQAIDNGTFDPEREKAADPGAREFSAFLDDYEREHVKGDRLRNTSYASYLALFREAFGNYTLNELASAGL